MRLAKNREKTQIWKIYPLNNKPRQNDGVCQQSEALFGVPFLFLFLLGWAWCRFSHFPQPRGPR